MAEAKCPPYSRWNFFKSIFWMNRGEFHLRFDWILFQRFKLTIFQHRFPASIATLAQRWPNVNPYVGPTSAHRRWPNVDLSIGPTLAQRWRANVGTTLRQWLYANVVPTLAQRCANGCMPTLYQHWPNGSCVTGFLSGEPIGHRWIPLTKGQERWRWCLPKQSVEQTVELSNRWFETPMWSTSM